MRARYVGDTFFCAHPNCKGANKYHIWGNCGAPAISTNISKVKEKEKVQAEEELEIANVNLLLVSMDKRGHTLTSQDCTYLISQLIRAWKLKKKKGI